MGHASPGALRIVLTALQTRGQLTAAEIAHRTGRVRASSVSDALLHLADLGWVTRERRYELDGVVLMYRLTPAGRRGQELPERPRRRVAA